jgi:hypothetical protein
MSNGHTSDWRLAELEKRMDRVEAWLVRGAVAAIGNLIGIIILLVQALAGHR